MNHCIFMGNLVEDPRVETVNGSKGDISVLKFRMGVNTRLNKDKSEVTFPTIECWGAQADLIGKHFRKGDLIRVYARLKTDSWEDKASGETRYRDKFAMEKFEFPETTRKRDKAEGDSSTEDTASEAEPEAPATPPADKPKGRARRGGKQLVGAGVEVDADGDLAIPF